MRRTSGHDRTECPGTAGPQRHIYLSTGIPGVSKVSTRDENIRLSMRGSAGQIWNRPW